MTDDPEIAGFRVIVNRSTGEPITDPIPVYVDDVPFQNIHPDQPLLRYMDYYKFEDLLENQALYFCRADIFQDPLEGTISKKEIHGTSASDIALAKHITMADGEYEKLQNFRETAKGCTFVNCWHINHQESQEMWDAYTESSDSVLVITTEQKLT